MIDDEAILAGRCEKAAIAGIADERLVAFLELPFERSQDCLAIGGVLLGLVVIAADDVAAAASVTALACNSVSGGAVRGWSAARSAAGRPAQARALLCRTLAHTEDVLETACSSAAMVAALIMPRSATMQTRPMAKRLRRRSTTGTSCSRRQCCRATSPSRPAARRWSMMTATIIWCSRPMILGVSRARRASPALALEIQRGGVHEHDGSRSVNRSRRRANSCSSTRSLSSAAPGCGRLARPPAVPRRARPWRGRGDAGRSPSTPSMR